MCPTARHKRTFRLCAMHGTKIVLDFKMTNTQFIYFNRDVYIAITLCSSLVHSANAIYIYRH
jgi:hypothetical protein